MTGLTKRVLSAAIILACALPLAAAEKKGDSAKEVGEKEMTYVSGATIDFSSALELNYASLSTLGSRIEQCRTGSPDPVGLAAAAHELAIAEKVSGKKAKLTSAGLLEEAIHMATVRDDSSDLKGILHYVKNEKAREELETACLKAERAEKVRSEQAKAGVETKGIHSQLIINNYSHQYMKIYYNRRYQGTVRPHGHRHFRIHDHSGHWDVHAIGSRGSRFHRHKHGAVRNYTWTLRSSR